MCEGYYKPKRKKGMVPSASILPTLAQARWLLFIIGLHLLSLKVGGPLPNIPVSKKDCGLSWRSIQHPQPQLPRGSGQDEMEGGHGQPRTEPGWHSLLISVPGNPLQGSSAISRLVLMPCPLGLCPADLGCDTTVHRKRRKQNPLGF